MWFFEFRLRVFVEFARWRSVLDNLPALEDGEGNEEDQLVELRIADGRLEMTPLWGEGEVATLTFRGDCPSDATPFVCPVRDLLEASAHFTPKPMDIDIAWRRGRPKDGPTASLLRLSAGTCEMYVVGVLTQPQEPETSES
jgi:hypothetical protein